MTTARKFTQRMKHACDISSTELGYNPTRMRGMLDSYGDGVQVAKMLIKSGDIQDGLKKMFDLGRGELALESIMLEPEFHELFSKKELIAAQWRVDQVAVKA